MTAASLLTELQAAGVRFIPSGFDRLRVDAPRGVITPEFRDALRQHKLEIITILKADPNKIRQTDGVELLYIFHERAAIIEIDGGILREEAECLAAREVFDTPEKLRIYAEQHPTIKLLLRSGGEIIDVRFSGISDELPTGETR